MTRKAIIGGPTGRFVDPDGREVSIRPTSRFAGAVGRRRRSLLLAAVAGVAVLVSIGVAALVASPSSDGGASRVAPVAADVGKVPIPATPTATGAAVVVPVAPPVPVVAVKPRDALVPDAFVGRPDPLGGFLGNHADGVVGTFTHGGAQPSTAGRDATPRPTAGFAVEPEVAPVTAPVPTPVAVARRPRPAPASRPWRPTPVPEPTRRAERAPLRARMPVAADPASVVAVVAERRARCPARRWPRPAGDDAAVPMPALPDSLKP